MPSNPVVERTGRQRLAIWYAERTGPPFTTTLDVTWPMGDKVLASLENSFGDYCVDIFARTDGTFGFEEYRRDPEDGGRWHSLHRYSSQVFTSQEDAVAQAKARVPWLKIPGA